MDLEKIVDAVTKVIMERLSGKAAAKVVAFGEIPEGLLCADCEIKQATASGDIEGADYIILTKESFRAIHGGKPEPDSLAEPAKAYCGGKRVIDLSEKRLIHERDLRDHNAQNGDAVKVSKKAIITALAHDYAKSSGVKINRE